MDIKKPTFVKYMIVFIFFTYRCKKKIPYVLHGILMFFQRLSCDLIVNDNGIVFCLNFWNHEIFYVYFGMADRAFHGVGIPALPVLLE